MKTKQTAVVREVLDEVFTSRTFNNIMTRLCKLEEVKPIKGNPHGVTLEVDRETKRQMAIEAQNLGLRSADELTQIVLHAFIELCKEDNFITFPLMLQQVETL
jgi:hypothetical protein